MKTNPQSSQITQVVGIEVAFRVNKGYQVDVASGHLCRLCSLRSLRTNSVEIEL